MQQQCWQPEDVLGNKYKIKKVLGQGQMGISYQVEHFDWEMPLRLKCFAQPYLAAHSQQLKYTIDRWIAFDGDPHIASAYYWDNIGNDRCLISEYVEGLPLDQYIQNLNHPAPLLDLAIQLAYALESSHKNRLFHRNLKFPNIILANDILFLNDFAGSLGEDAEKAMHHDFLQYAQILESLFSLEAIKNSVPKEVIESIQLCKNGNPTWTQLVSLLKAAYETLQSGLYKRSSLISARVQVEKLHKQAIAYCENQELTLAQSLWNLAGENNPPSMNALWNNYLLGLRQGAISLNLFIKTMEDLTAFEHSQILHAQAELALEVGCHIQETLERLQSTELTTNLMRVKGEILYRIRSFSEAAQIFQQILEKTEKNKDDWYRLAISYFHTQEFSKAKEVCQQGIQENPNHALLHLVLAVCCYSEGNDELAAEAFQKLLEKYPNVFWVLMHVGDFYAGRGLYTRNIAQPNLEKARACYEKVLAISPLNSRAIRGFKASGGQKVPSPGKYCIHLQEWSQIRRFVGHASLVTSVAMTPDGKWLISGDCDGNLYLWDIEKDVLTTGLIGHSKHITSLAITPDGKQVASASWDHSIRIWETPSGSCFWEIQGHHDKVTSVRFTPDGKYLISGSWDGTAKIWDIQQHKLLHVLEHAGVWITDVAIAANLQWALVCTEEEMICLWDLSNIKMLQQLRGLSVCLSADATLAVTSNYGSLEWWEIPSGKTIDSMSTPRKETCLGLTQDNTILLTKNDDDILSFWDLSSKQKLSYFTGEEASCASISPSGDCLATGANTMIYLWENIGARPFPLFQHTHFLPAMIHDTLKTPDMLEQIYRNAELAFEQKKYVEAFRLYQSIVKIPGYENSELLYEQMNECAIRHPILRKTVHSIILKASLPMIGPATGSAIAADGRIVLIGNDDDPIRQWNLQSGYISHRWESHERCVSALAINDSGSRALSGSWDGSAIFWNLDHPNECQTLPVTNTWITAIAMNPEATFGLIGTKDGKIVLWDLTTFQSKCLHQGNPDAIVCHVVLKSQIAVAALLDGTVLSWDMINGNPIEPHRPNERYITALDTSYDGTLVLSSSRNSVILLWETRTGKVLKEFQHEGEVVKYIKYLQDRSFISIAKDGGLRVWSLDSPECLSYYYIHDSPISTVALANNGRFLVSADESKTLKLWELEWEWDLERI